MGRALKDELPADTFNGSYRINEVPSPALDGIFIDCTLGNASQRDTLFPEDELAAPDDDPLGILWLSDVANGV